MTKLQNMAEQSAKSCVLVFQSYDFEGEDIGVLSADRNPKLKTQNMKNRLWVFEVGMFWFSLVRFRFFQFVVPKGVL